MLPCIEESFQLSFVFSFKKDFSISVCIVNIDFSFDVFVGGVLLDSRTDFYIRIISN